MTTWNHDYDRFVAHYSAYEKKPSSADIPSDGVYFYDADFGRNVGFNRIAPHHIILPPQCRTSFPHAESLEEEFVFVIKGNPHLWLNGYLHELREGHAVGFPAGTGIAHSFINNTSTDVHLLVAGERTKPENLCSFPINPELKANCQIWWENPPLQNLGPHSGRPKPVLASETSAPLPDCVFDCSTTPAPQGNPFHYPGDSESFGTGIRLTDKIGLKALGVWFEKLPAGKRSAFPHAHTHEEEFVFVLKGNPTIWLDGFAKRVEPGYFAAFPSNTGIAHVIINDTQEEVVYLCIGETAEFPEEKVTYPLNNLRRRECERKGWYWDNPPPRPQGSASPTASPTTEDHLVFRLCDERSSQDAPLKESFKEKLIIDFNNEPVGVIELHAHHPETGVCSMVLFLIKDSLVGTGFGKKCFEFTNDYIKRSLGCKTIRVGSTNDHEVMKYWEFLGLASHHEL